MGKIYSVRRVVNQQELTNKPIIDKFPQPSYSIKSDDEILSSFARIGTHTALWYIDCTYRLQSILSIGMEI